MTAEYGRRLMPSILQQEAQKNPDRIFAIHAKSDDLKDGFITITFGQIARAVDYISNWLQSRFEGGEKPQQFETLTYIGVPDVRYNILFYAAAQCRYKVFLPSPRNPVAVNLSLCEQTKCTKLVHSVEVASAAMDLEKAASGMQREQLPSLEELLEVPVSEYPYDFSFDEVRNDPVLILHSSGSTGLPKPVIHTHGNFGTYDVRDWPTVPGRRTQDTLGMLTFDEPGSSIYDVFPPFHIAGFATKLMVPLYNLTVVIFGPSTRPPSGSLAAAIIKQHKPRGVLLPPTIAEQLFHEPGGASILDDVDVMFFAGGPLPNVVGDEISKHTTLCQFYGSTEAGQMRQLVPLPGEWSYMCFNPHENFEMQPSGDNLFELVIFADKSLERTSTLYHNYPDIHEWRTKDLFSPHPDKPGLWKFHARKDDILVFSSGEKLNPITMETYVSGVDGVSGALVVGNGERQAALLLELNPDFELPSDPVDHIWPTVEQANALLPAHGRISKSMVIIASKEKPFARAGKGTVVRRLTDKLYENEIRQLFKETSSDAPAKAIAFKPSSFSEGDVKGLIHSILSAISVGDGLEDHQNFYTYGVDSVKTAEIVGQLRASLRPYKSADALKLISIETVYRNPSIQQLSCMLLDFLNKGSIDTKRDRKAEIEAMAAKYVEQITQTKNSIQNSVHHSDTFSVAITGTTGYFGSYLLRELIDTPGISQIFCLNRSATAEETFRSRYPNVKISNVTFLKVNLTDSNIGLEPAMYAILQSSLNAIIHNAWRVDFNLSLSSFALNLSSLPPILNLSLSSPSRPRVYYISSISATGVWGPLHSGSQRQTIPESFVDDPSIPMNIGYAESKYVAEKIMHEAAKKLGANATILRMGQISPSSNPKDGDTWPSGDVMSIFFRSAKAMKTIAIDVVESIDWVPVDYAAKITSEIVASEMKTRGDDGGEKESCYNIVHPHPRSWETVIDRAREWCGEGTGIVDMKNWVGRLRELETESEGNGEQDLEKIPALRMTRVYEIMAKHGPQHAYAFEKLKGKSESLGKMPIADDELLGMWLGKV